MRIIFLAAAGCVSALAIAGSGTAKDVQRTLWIDARHVNLADPGVVDTVLAQPVQRVIVSCFAQGETLFPSENRMFARMALYEGRDHVLASFLTAAHLRGKQVYAFIDCLHWARSDTLPQRDPFRNNAELLERTANGGTGPDGKYASPFNPKVGQILHGMVSDLALAHPQLDGLVLQCRLSNAAFLGYSKAARLAYLRAAKTDPATITLSDSKGQETPAATAWRAWRVEQVAGLVRDLSDKFHSMNTKAGVAVVGRIQYYRLSTTEQNTSLEDVLRWREASRIDELVLEWLQGPPQYAAGFGDYTAAATKTGRPVGLTLLPRGLDGGALFSPDQLARDTHGHQLTSLAVRVSGPADLAAVQNFLTSHLAPAEPLLSRLDLQQLQDDPRLQVRVSMDLKQPGLRDVLVPLEQATALRLTSDEVSTSKPILGSLSIATAPAWSVMRDLAMSQKVQGHWQTTENGYHLTVTQQPEDDVTVAGSGFGRRWRSVASAVVLLGLIAWVVYRTLRGDAAHGRVR